MLNWRLTPLQPKPCCLSAGLGWRRGSCVFRFRSSLAPCHVDIHGLEGNLSRSREPVPANLAGAGENSRGELLKHGLHLHGTVLVNPASRFDVDNFAGTEGDFKHVAVAMQPKNAILRRARKGVDEEARTAQQDVGSAFDPREGVIHVVRRGQPLMFPHVHAHAGRTRAPRRRG